MIAKRVYEVEVYKACKLLNNKRYVSKLYFREINSFFDFFEKKYKTKIIISLHPRTTQISINKKYFNNRKCFIDKSHKLVSSCKYVFLHPSTTALNLPIIYKKPAMIKAKIHYLLNIGLIKSNDKIVIFGSGTSGRQLAKGFLEKNIELKAFIDNKEGPPNRKVMGYSARGFPKGIENYLLNEFKNCKLVIAISEINEKIFLKKMDG